VTAIAWRHGGVQRGKWRRGPCTARMQVAQGAMHVAACMEVACEVGWQVRACWWWWWVGACVRVVVLVLVEGRGGGGGLETSATQEPLHNKPLLFIVPLLDPNNRQAKNVRSSSHQPVACRA
jgi:hypothetical protein